MRKYSLIAVKQEKEYVAGLAPIGADQDPAAVYVASEVDERVEALEKALRGLISKIELFDNEDDGGLSRYDPAVLEAKKLVTT